MTPKTIKIAAISAAVAVAGYWYWSPFLAMREIQSAVQQRDADAVNERVDYPKLRESLRGQLLASLDAFRTKTPDEDNPYAGLRSALTTGMVDRLVEARVRPELVMQAVQNAQMPFTASQIEKTPAHSSINQGSPTKAALEVKPTWSYKRINVDKLIAYATDPTRPDVPNQEKFGLVFQRSGFADWKLTEFRLPTYKN